MELGTRLREAREAKKLSLEEVQDVTKIQKRYLQAIEKGNLSVLPGKFYARAFIREYAAAVGLDPDEVMETHANELPASEDESINYTRLQRSKKESVSTGPGFSKLFPTIMTVLLIILIAFAIWYFVRLQMEPDTGGGQTDEGTDEFIINDPAPSSNEDDEEAAEENGEEDQNATEDKEAPEEEPEEPEQPELELNLVEEGTGSFPMHTFELKNAEEINVTLELDGKSYLEVKEGPNGEHLTSPVNYSEGDSPLEFEFTGKDQIYISMGFAPAVTVKINDEVVDFPVDKQSQKFLIDIVNE
ncbi:helix-turn-helix domain-containing protein [Thalassobacillus hwangdonensis]|uniref:Helix-turn-helix domain-containing protein n=1 Tax=Thalassobacillus hwangdonensis TaxID=546108 RepID=A0ABW3KZM2_9BACI